MGQEKPIKEQIGHLIELQVVDKEIYALDREKAGIPSQLKKIDEEIETEKTNLLDTERNLKNLQVKLKDKEMTLQEKEEQIKKLQIQLYQIKTNREYTAMLTEIGGVKADNSLIEEEMIKLMDDIDSAKKRIEEEKKRFAEKEKNSSMDKERLSTRSKEIESRIKELDEKRAGVTPLIDKNILVRYERVLKNKEGLAIVPVEGGACGGCHISLPPQVVSEVKLREELVVCGSCSRILYIDENVEVN